MSYFSFAIQDDLFCYLWRGAGNNCNTYLFKSVLRGGFHALVDPGQAVNEMGETPFADLISALNRDEVDIQDVGLVINTHSHPDHCQANENLLAINKHTCVTLSREEDDFRHNLRKRMFSLLGMKLSHFEPLFYLKEGNLNLKDTRLTVISTPGHSPGSISLYSPQHRALLSGDVIFYGGMGRTDFPGCSLATLKQSIDRLSRLTVDYLLPGHMDIVAGKDKVERNFGLVKLLL